MYSNYSIHQVHIRFLLKLHGREFTIFKSSYVPDTYYYFCREVFGCVDSYKLGLITHTEDHSQDHKQIIENVLIFVKSGRGICENWHSSYITAFC